MPSILAFRPDNRLDRQSITALILLIFLALGGCRANPPTRVSTAEPMNREANLASYDEMFLRISESYYAPSRLASKEVDWDNLRLQLRPKIEAAKTMTEVRLTMSEALNRLGETHFAIVPAELRRALPGNDIDQSTMPDASTVAETGSVGVHVRVCDGVPVVSMIDDGSEAATNGVKTGWAIDSINDKPVKKAADQIHASFGDVPLTAVRIADWIESQLSPPIGETVRVRFSSVDGKSHTAKLTSQRQPGMWASFGMLPAMNLRFGARRLPDDIGYFSLSVFLNPPQVMPAYSAFIKANQTARGIIIDLRGNPGGLGAMATGMCGFLLADDGKKLGTMIRRDGNLQFVVNPRYPQFTGPVAVLVDGLSMSTSEILAGGLQDLGRARIFGQQTPGAALPSTITQLPNGDGLQFALADYVSASGRRLEGKGIVPDEVVPLNRASLEAGHDDVLEAACKWIRDQAAHPSVAPAAN